MEDQTIKAFHNPNSGTIDLKPHLGIPEYTQLMSIVVSLVEEVNFTCDTSVVDP